MTQNETPAPELPAREAEQIIAGLLRTIDRFRAELENAGQVLFEYEIERSYIDEELKTLLNTRGHLKNRRGKLQEQAEKDAQQRTQPGSRSTR